MSQAQKYQAYVPYLWAILFVILTLVPLYLAADYAQNRIAYRQPSAGEVIPLPEFSPPGGYYDRDIQVRINVPHLTGAERGQDRSPRVIFTVDGSLPTHAVGTIYRRPILITAVTPGVTVVRARAVTADNRLGPVVSASYFAGVPATLPMMSLIVDPDDLWGQERGIYTHFEERGEAWERSADITYVDQDRRSGFHVLSGIRIHGGASRGFDKKSFRLYFRREYGTSRLEYPLFADSEVRSFKRLVLHSGGQDCPNHHRGTWGNWTLLRNHLADDLMLQLGGYASHNQPVLLFINSEPWGIYVVREYLDSHFLADRYGIGSSDLLDAPDVRGEQNVLSGDDEHWDQLLQFVQAHDLAEPAHYAYVQSQIDITDLIDYGVLQIYAANVDWPQHNVRQFRPRVQGGRWHWLVWDSDVGFGAYPRWPYSRAESDLIQLVLTLDHDDMGGRDLLLLRKLLENPAFLERFLSRIAGLLNGTLSPRSVTAHIDTLAAELEPDIAYETTRWPSSVDWQSNVQVLRDLARRRPNFVRQHVVEGFGLSGTAQLVLNPPIGGEGYVAVDGMLVQDFPWQGIYFQGVPVRVVAVPAPGYRFDGWDPPDLPQAAAVTLTLGSHGARALAPRFEAIPESTPRPGDVILVGYPVDQDNHTGSNQFALRVTRPGGVDLRGWRITDNDTKTATDEGSLILADHPAFARVPRGTTILVMTSASSGKEDDLGTWDRQMILYVDNDNLDRDVDPGFSLGPNDNLVLLAPGPTESFGDDRGIAFIAHGTAVTPASFGVLTDGVLDAFTPMGGSQ